MNKQNTLPTQSPGWQNITLSSDTQKTPSRKETKKQRNHRARRDVEDYFEQKRIRELIKDELDSDYKNVG